MDATMQGREGERVSHRQYFVYIMSSERGVLYVGVTRDLDRRIHEHRQGIGGAFSRRYGTKRLVYFEVSPDIRSAIQREKQIKGWRRKRKLELIRASNPTFEDLLE
jgi:putative endonuclease